MSETYASNIEKKEAEKLEIINNFKEDIEALNQEKLALVDEYNKLQDKYSNMISDHKSEIKKLKNNYQKMIDTLELQSHVNTVCSCDDDMISEDDPILHELNKMFGEK